MTSRRGFEPDWASPPGDTIADILEERQISLPDFARRMGQTAEDAAHLLQGRSTITIGVARRLAEVLGGSVSFWMTRDFQYREDTARLHATDEEWINELPVGDMIRFGWISPIPHPAQEMAACLRFFEVATVRAWRQAYQDLQDAVAFRTSPSFDSRPAAVAAWLRQGEIEAQAIRCGPWSATRLRESLPIIRALTRKKDPGLFIPELQRCCAQCGVAVALVRAPSGCRASGATRFISEDKALLLLSFRYLTDDQFWFSFFHEAGHLLLHGKERLFLEGEGTLSTSEEREANDFAAQTLVPSEFQQELRRLPTNALEVVKFGRRVGVAPGIIVGQLQHIGRVSHSHLNRLKRRFQWKE